MKLVDFLLNDYELEERDFSSLLYIRVFCFSPILGTKTTKVYFSSNAILLHCIDIINTWQTKDVIVIAITSPNTIEIIRRPHNTNHISSTNELNIKFDSFVHVIHNALPDHLQYYLNQHNTYI